MPFSTDEEQVEAFFSRFGEVLNTRLVRNDMGNLRGFGFVEFLERSSVYDALEADEEEFGGRLLQVKQTEKPKRRMPREPLE